jgi:hypothetical protein
MGSDAGENHFNCGCGCNAFQGLLICQRGFRQSERRQPHHTLANEVERSLRCGQHFHGVGTAKQLDDKCPHFGGDAVAVIQHDQHAPLLQYRTDSRKQLTCIRGRKASTAREPAANLHLFSSARGRRTKHRRRTPQLMRRANSSTHCVLPMPPGPRTVTARCVRTNSAISLSSSSRPIRLSMRAGSRTAGGGPKRTRSAGASAVESLQRIR